MSETQPQSRRERSIIYTVVAVILIALAVIAFVMFRTDRKNAESEAKAEELVQAFESAGLVAPSVDQLAQVLGDDGGPVCDDPNGALTQALVLGELSSGASGPGRRPVIAEDRVLKSQLLIISVYCPDALPDFQKFVDELNTVNGS